MLSILASGFSFSPLEMAAIGVAGLILIAGIIAIIVQIYLIIKYKNLNKKGLEKTITASDTARALLDKNGLQDVQVKKLGFFRRILLFGNHYSVMKKTIFLRGNILNSSSVTAVGIATQKVCLAVQHANGDKSFKLRYVAQILSFCSPIFFYLSVIVGLVIDFVLGFSGIPSLIGLIIAIAFYLMTFVYSIANIKVEKKANAQAIELLEKSEMFNEEELASLKELFKLYILSYVIDLILSILKLIEQILKILIKFQRSK